MELQFIVTDSRADDRPRAERKRRLVAGPLPGTIGGEPGCAVELPGLPPTVAVLARETGDRSTYSIRATSDAMPVLLNGHPVPVAPEGVTATHLPNGGELTIGDYHLRVVVVFQAAAFRRRLGFLPTLTLLAMLAALIFEVAFLLTMPRAVRVDAVLVTELARQTAFTRIDTLRADYLTYAKSRPSSPTAIATLAVLQDETDRVAHYLRLNGSTMSREQLRSMQQDLDMLTATFRDLQAGTLYAPDPVFDETPMLQSLIPAEEASP